MDNPGEEAVEVVIELLKEQNKLLLDIRNLAEDNTQLEKLNEELHRLSTAVGQNKQQSSSSDGRKSLPTTSWFQEGETWLCEKPNDAPGGKCNQCQKPIFWILSKKGKKVPISMHPNFPSKFSAHFPHCEKAGDYSPKSSYKKETNDDGPKVDLPF